jgi:hypothetical protein
MAKRVRVKKRKYMGDDCYSWAVFVDGIPKVTGCASREADSYVKQFRKEIGEK